MLSFFLTSKYVITVLILNLFDNKKVNLLAFNLRRIQFVCVSCEILFHSLTNRVGYKNNAEFFLLKKKALKAKQIVSVTDKKVTYDLFRISVKKRKIYLV